MKKLTNEKIKIDIAKNELSEHEADIDQALKQSGTLINNLNTLVTTDISKGATSEQENDTEPVDA